MGRVPRERRRAEAGQVAGEYAIVLGVIALVCVVAVIVLGAGIHGAFEQGGEGVQQAPYRPPTPSAQSWPTTLADCEDGGWQNYPQFANEADCRAYVDGLGP